MALLTGKSISELISEYETGIADDFSDIYTGTAQPIRYAQELSYSELDF